MTTFIAVDGSTVTPITRADLMQHPAFAGLDTDNEGNPCVWQNGYTCQTCTSEQIDWTDDWSCSCDDDCPNCGKSHSPHDQQWLADSEVHGDAYCLWESLPEAESPKMVITEPKPGPMWICAWTENHGNNDLRDTFSLHEDEGKARSAYDKLINECEILHCAAIAPVATATEPHWMGAA